MRRSIVLTTGILFAYLAVFVGVVMIADCTNFASTSELRARTSLDAIADVVDPAYQLAMQGCADLEDHAMTLGELDATTPAQTEAALAAISARCHTARNAFDKIRAAHDQAVAFVEDGKFDQAIEQLDQMREAWRQLRERVIDDHG